MLTKCQIHSGKTHCIEINLMNLLDIQLFETNPETCALLRQAMLFQLRKFRQE